MAKYRVQARAKVELLPIVVDADDPEDAWNQVRDDIEHEDGINQYAEYMVKNATTLSGEVFESDSAEVDIELGEPAAEFMVEHTEKEEVEE
jgi:hypothetical protein